MRARLSVAGLVPLLVLVLSCSSGGGGAPAVAAVVGGVDIPASETEELIRAYAEQQRQAGEEDGHEPDRESTARFAVLYQIKHAYLEQLAAGMGISIAREPQDEEIAQLAPPEDYEAAGLAPEELVRETRAGRLSKALAEKLFPEVPVTEDVLRQEYERRASVYDTSWRVRAQVASFTSPDGPKQLGPGPWKRESFEQAATELGALNVGTIDITPLSGLPQPILDAVGGLAASEVSAPIQVSTSGWASILAETREDLPKLSFEEVRAELTTYLADQQRLELFQTWFAKRLRTAPVEVDEHYGRWDPKVGTIR